MLVFLLLAAACALPYSISYLRTHRQEKGAWVGLLALQAIAFALPLLMYAFLP